MVDLLLGLGLAVHALLLMLWPGRVEEAKPVEEHVVEEPKPVRRSKPFRTRRAFREVRRQFEDAHDPRRMSLERVERFAKQAEKRRDDR
jgi:hypothetical protein